MDFYRQVCYNNSIQRTFIEYDLLETAFFVNGFYLTNYYFTWRILV